jgi:hypothetical protein
MCDICQQEGVDELALEYVLTKETSNWHGTYTISRTTELARVHASVCELCYQERVGAGNEPSAKERGFWAGLRRAYRAMTRPTKEQVVASLAREKLARLYPTEISQAVDPGSMSFGRTRYEFQRADSWDAQRSWK